MKVPGLTLCLLLALAVKVEAEPAVTVLLTPGFKITLTNHCQEGEVTCMDVGYYAVSLKSGHSIRLKGETVHSLCADGTSPCRFLGYRFVNGDVTYEISDSGLLSVTQKTKVLLQQQGVWQ